MVQSLTRSNASVTGYQYDPVMKMLIQVDNAASINNPTSCFEYTYNNQDLVKAETIAGLISLPSFQEGMTEYDYHEVNQLLSASEKNQVFTHDGDGNMVTGYTPLGFGFTVGYDCADRLISIEYQDDQRTDEDVYQYDAAMVCKFSPSKKNRDPGWWRNMLGMTGHSMLKSKKGTNFINCVLILLFFVLEK